MTPKNAIKLRCKDCQTDTRSNELCIDCALKNDSLTNLKKIKAYCKWCCNGFNPKDWCNSSDCSLFDFKMGKNPNKKGNAESLKNIKFRSVIDQCLKCLF